MVLDYDIINKEELSRALVDIMPEYSKYDDFEKMKIVDKIAEAIGSKSTLGMLVMMFKKEALRKA
jgi:plasmid replication initiation protein